MSEQTVAVVGMREPCPCGSGKRYKNCHGRDGQRQSSAFVSRPFEGLACEAQLVMLAEFLASATAPLPLAKSQKTVPSGVKVTAATLLPNAFRGIRVSGKSMFLGLQNTFNSGDRSRDAADAIEILADAGPQEYADCQSAVEPGDRLNEIIAADQLLNVTVHEDFEWWHETGVVDGFEVEDLEDLNSSVIAADPIEGVPAAYLVHLPQRPQIRLALPYPEEASTDAYARLTVAKAEGLGDGTKLLGNFRAHGILVSVWDIATEDASHMVAPVQRFLQRFSETVASTAALTSDERRARQSVVAKHVTIRK